MPRAISASVGWRIAREQGLESKDLAGGAEAALQGVVGDKGLLHGVERVAVGQSLDGRDRRARRHSTASSRQL